MAAAVTASAVMLLVRPWPLDVPVSYGGDSFQHALLVQTVDWTGTPGVDHHSGAPAGTDWSGLPTGGERLQLVVLDGLRNLTGDPFAAINLYVILAIVATAVVSFLVLRWMAVMPLVAGAAAVVFSLSPAVYARVFDGHLFLFALWPAPLAVWLACRSTGWRPAQPDAPSPGTGPSPRAATARPLLVVGAAVLFIGVSSTYYAVFSLLLIGGLGMVVAVRRGRLVALAAPVASAAAIGLTLLITTLPDFLGDHRAAPVQRRLADSDRYGLRLVQLLLPSRNHPVGVLAGIGARAQRSVGAADAGAPIGLLAVVGLGIVLWVCLRRAGRPRDAGDRLSFRLGALAALAVVTATAGGAGYLLAMLGLADLRAWSRLSVFVGFCGIAGAAVAADRRARWQESASSGTSAGVLGVASLVTLLALFDQRGVLSTRSQVVGMLAADREVVSQMEEALPTGASVLELPAISFPDDFGSERLAALPMLAARDGTDLSFSAAAFRGGPGDWQQSWALEPLGRQAEAAAAAGFDALVLDRAHHLWGHPGAIIDSLTAAIGAPAGHSGDGTWVWWDLRPLRARLGAEHGLRAVAAAGAAVVRPVGVTVHGTPGVPSTGSERDAFLNPDAAVVLRRYDANTAPVVVRGRIRAAEGAVVRINAGGHTTEMRPGPDGRAVEVVVPMAGEEERVNVRTDGPPLTETPELGRQAAELTDLQVFDASLPGSAVAPPAPPG